MSSPTATKAEGTSAIAPRQKFEGHTSDVWGVIHLPGGERIITCSNDGSLRVWNLESVKQIGGDWREGESEVYTIALSPDGKKVVSGSRDGALRLWDMDKGKVTAKWTEHRHSVFSVCWSRDGRRVLSGSDDSARQWDVETGETILAPIKTGHERVWAAVYSPDMTVFATGGYHKNEHLIKIWDTKTGELVAVLKGHTNSVECLVWTPDGTTLISGSWDTSIRTWNTTTWKKIAVLDGHINCVFAIAISPNGRILASASSDKTARLWNLDNGQSINSPLQHAERVLCVSFSEDGKLLATGCGDNNAYTWDVSAIVRKSGLGHLLKLQGGNKTLPFNNDATRRPAVQRRVPPGFFDPPPDRAHFSPRRHDIAAPQRHTLLGRISSLFSHTYSDANDTPPRPRPLDGPRNLLSETLRRPTDAGIELHDRPSAVVDVPCTQGKRRNATAREKRRPIPLKSTNATAGSSRPPPSSVTQQSSGATHSQPFSQPHAAVSTSSARPGVVATSAATTSTTSPPDVTIRHASGWTRFWLFVCCASVEYANSHN